MTDPWDGIAWSSLVHFFGSAADLPEHFTAWLGGSVRERLDSGVYLRHANFSLGPWPATAPTAAVLADLLDGRGLDEEEIYVPLLFIDTIAHICDLGNRAESIRKRSELHADDITTWTADYTARDDAARKAMRSDAPELMSLVQEASQLACFDMIPRLITTVTPYLDDERVVRRSWLAATLAALARHPSVADQRPALAARVEHLAHAQTDDHGLATLLLALGDLEGDPRAWLAHPHLGVRYSAALARSLAGDAIATSLREELVRSPEAYFASFAPDVVPPAQFVAPPYSMDLAGRLLERARACSAP